eukprot:629444-Amphidinium_carterae.1
MALNHAPKRIQSLNQHCWVGMVRPERLLTSSKSLSVMLLQTRSQSRYYHRKPIRQYPRRC